MCNPIPLINNIGAAVNGTGQLLTGGSFKDGALEGAEVGFYAGSVGGFGGAMSYQLGYSGGLEESAGLGKFLTTKSGLSTFVSAGALIPFGVYKANVSIKD